MREKFPHLQTKTLLFSLLGITLIAAVLRTLSLLLCFDAEIGYFKTGSALPILSTVFLALSIAACIAIPFLINKGHIPALSVAPTTAEMLGGTVTALFLLLAAFYLLIKGRTALSAPALLTVLASLLSLLGAGFFLTRLFTVKTETRALFGYAMILGAALLLIVAYFDRYTQMNAPHKIAQHLCMLSMMMGVLFEVRALLGRDLPRTRLCLLSLSFVLCAILALSNTVAFLAGAYDDLTYLAFDLPALGYAVYAAGRLPFVGEKEDV